MELSVCGVNVCGVNFFFVELSVCGVNVCGVNYFFVELTVFFYYVDYTCDQHAASLHHMRSQYSVCLKTR